MSNINDSQVIEPTVKKDRGISPLWIFTLLAFVLAGWLLYRSVNEAGERIQIYFTDAQGIQAGRTTIRYQGLEVGMIRRVTLSDDLKSIYAEADIYPEATKILSQNTVFWVVRPKASITGISGLMRWYLVIILPYSLALAQSEPLSSPPMSPPKTLLTTIACIYNSKHLT
nr:MlaD family protein [Enterovibrio nigricans]